MDVPPPSVIVVETRYFFLQWVFVFCTPRISIDGWPPERRPWGRHPYVVPPGPHRVEVFVPYMFFTRMGANSVDFQVGPGDVVEILWKAPWITLMPGSMSTGYVPGAARGYAEQAGLGYDPANHGMAAPSMGAPVAAGGWFPDPAARHQLRYFDGATWTPHVSDAGVVAVDPI